MMTFKINHNLDVELRYSFYKNVGFPWEGKPDFKYWSPGRLSLKIFSRVFDIQYGFTLLRWFVGCIRVLDWLEVELGIRYGFTLFIMMVGGMYSCLGSTGSGTWWAVPGSKRRGVAASGCASTLSVHGSNLRLRKYHFVCNLRLLKYSDSLL